MKTRIIINRHIVAKNRKHIKEGGSNETCEPTISIQTYKEIQYAKHVKLSNEWQLIQDMEKSPCSGATIWLEGEHTNMEIIE